jgi:hypothetical protein
MNGPRGGVDKRCRILVKLRAAGSDNITIEQDDKSLNSAVARAAARAGRTVGRSLERRHRKRAYQRRRALAKDLQENGDR